MAAKENKTKQSDSGISSEIAALMAYALSIPTCGLPISGAILLLIEKKDTFVIFHAWQSIVLLASIYIIVFAMMLVSFIFGNIAFIFLPIITFFSISVKLGGFVLIVWCSYKAYKKELWRIPFIGDMAARLAKIDKK